MSTEHFDIIVSLARALFRNYKSVSDRLDMWSDDSARLAGTLFAIGEDDSERASIRRELNHLLTIEQRETDRCDQFAKQLQELATLVALHLPDAAKACLLVSVPSTDPDLRRCPWLRSDEEWAELDRQLKFIEVEAVRSAHGANRETCSLSAAAKQTSKKPRGRPRGTRKHDPDRDEQIEAVFQQTGSMQATAQRLRMDQGDVKRARGRVRDRARARALSTSAN